MDDINICRFVPVHNTPEWIHIINFVYETTYSGKTENKLDTCYKMAYVTDGSCTVSCRGSQHTVSAGDIFFVFPSVPYTLSAQGDFRFLYISFIGVQANRILEQLHITPSNSVFHSHSSLRSLWMDAVIDCHRLPELAAQGVLYYSFFRISCETLRQEVPADMSETAYKMQMVKKYIDDHFSDSTLSLEGISREFSYNKKYLSSAFKQQFKVGIREYLTTVRINHACVLMEQRYTSVKDIAYLCGFNEQMYFSRVFRKIMGVSPREHIKTIL